MELEHSFTVPVGVDEAWRILLDIERIGPCMPGATIESVDGDDFTGNVKVKLGPINLTYKGKASFVEKDEVSHRAVIDARGRDARGNGTAAAKVTATLTDSGGRTEVRVRTDLDITGKPAQFGRGVMVDVGNKLIGQFADCLASTIGEGDGLTPSVEPASAPARKAAAQKAPAQKAAAQKAPAKKAPAKKAAAKKAPAEKAAGSEPGPAGDLAAAAEAVAEQAPISGSAPQATDAQSGFTTAAVPSAPEPDEEPSVNGHATATPQPQREAEPIDLLQSAGPAVAKRLVPVLAPVAVAAVVVLVVARRRRR